MASSLLPLSLTFLNEILKNVADTEHIFIRFKNQIQFIWTLYFAVSLSLHAL